jgi:hypothetical protein
MEPWRQTVQTYSWVTEQEERSSTLNSNAWPSALPILSQSHILFSPRPSTSNPPNPSQRTKPSTSKTIVVEVEPPHRETTHEHQVEKVPEPERRNTKGAAAAARQREREERERLERVRLWEEENERQIQRARRAHIAVLHAWNAYENGWATIMAPSSSPPLTFRTIPWPLITAPSSPSLIAPAAIVFFLLSPLHSVGQSRKERIRRALLRWHPDKLGRVRARVKQGPDREWVEEGLSAVVRCLNELMNNEGKTRSVG